jgi:hypothetical protein
MLIETNFVSFNPAPSQLNFASLICFSLLKIPKRRVLRLRVLIAFVIIAPDFKQANTVNE